MIYSPLSPPSLVGIGGDLMHSTLSTYGVRSFPHISNYQKSISLSTTAYCIDKASLKRTTQLL